MPGGRSQRPLFDLLRDKTSAEQKSHAHPQPGPAPSPAGAPVVEAKPTGASSQAVPPIAKPRVVSAMPRPVPPAGDADDSRGVSSPRSGLTIPTNAIYIAPVVVLVLVLAVWMLGVRWGRNDAERSLVADGGITLPTTPSDPLTAPTVATQQPPAALPARPTTTPPVEVAKPNTGPNGVPLDPNGKLLSSRGPISTDPRTKGLNYLHIASLPLDDAQNALAYLAQNKIEAIAVPMGVDSGAQTAKNQSWYQVVVLVGITGDEYRNRDKPGRAKQAEALIRKLGSQWKNDKRGPSDFSKILWVRCQ